MSVKVSGAVWDAPLPQGLKLMMLALADHADHDGENIFPSVGTLARKTGYSERQVQRLLKELWNLGLTDKVGQSKYGTNVLRINLAKLAAYQPQEAPAETDEDAPPALAVEGGDKMSPPLKMAGGDKMSPGGCQNVTGGVTKCHRGGDIAMSPDPYLTVIKPSVEPSVTSGPKNTISPPDEKLRRSWDGFLYTMKQETPLSVYRKYIEPLELVGIDAQFEPGASEIKPVRVVIQIAPDKLRFLQERIKRRAERFFSATFGDAVVDFQAKEIEPSLEPLNF